MSEDTSTFATIIFLDTMKKTFDSSLNPEAGRIAKLDEDFMHCPLITRILLIGKI